MSSIKVCGQEFWYSQADMLRRAKNAQILIKYTPKQFTYFDSFHDFSVWFKNMRKVCKRLKKPFEVYELLTSGRHMCFICDIEVYFPTSISDADFERVQYTLKRRFTEVYDKYGDGSNVIFMQDHRPSSYRQEGSSEPKMKLSFHALGLSEIFDEIHTTCETKKLAGLVNKDVVAATAGVMSKHGAVLQLGNILDMSIYTKNRAMRTVDAQKDANSGGFQLSEEYRHVVLQNCFVTKCFHGEEVTLYTVPEEFQDVDVGTKPVKEKRETRNTPTRTTPKCGDDA